MSRHPYPPIRHFLPWRSARLPQTVAVVTLVVGLPLYLRMPPWCDVTLYDVAARNLLRGGVHYRDVFDTNLPGFVWLVAGVRSLLGWSSEALRVVDLAAFAGVVVLLDRLAKRGGGSPAARAWAVLGAVLVYPFASEFVQMQRDMWLALPALGAVALRVRRAVGEGRGGSVWEGVLWGCAVWIKPHVVLVAGAVWMVTAARVAAGGGRRAVLRDLLGNLAGGLLVGVPGVLWLVGSGTWPHFVEVVVHWNAGYGRLIRHEFPDQLWRLWFWFPPWTYLWVLAVPLAAADVVAARPWAAKTGGAVRLVRAAVAASYLSWFAVALFLQRGFQYVHTPETLLMLTLFAAHRWAVVGVVAVWLTLTSAAWWVSDVVPPVRRPLVEMTRRSDHLDALLTRHPLAYPWRTAWWPDCFRFGLSEREYYARANAVRFGGDHAASINWEQLHEAAVYLRVRGVGDGDLIAWHDTTHPLYLMLDIRPGIRFQHVNTALRIARQAEAVRGDGAVPLARFQAEVEAAAGRAGFVVSDLEAVADSLPAGRQDSARAAAAGPADLLPPDLPARFRTAFPYTQPVVFRSKGGAGRYVVHELRVFPIGETTRLD